MTSLFGNFSDVLHAVLCASNRASTDCREGREGKGGNERKSGRSRRDKERKNPDGWGYAEDGTRQRESADRKWHHPQPPLTIVVLELYEGPDQARFKSRTKAVDDTRDRFLWFVQVVIIWTRVGAVTYFCTSSVAPSRRNKQVISFFLILGTNRIKRIREYM